MAVVDYFLKLEGIDGEATDSKHTNEIDVETWSWGATQGGTGAQGGGHGAGKVQMQDFHFTMKTCKASPKLMLAVATGQHIPKGTLVCRKAGGKQEEFVKWIFTDLMVSSYQTGGTGHNDVLPMDQISLNFAKVELEYCAQKKDGTLDGAIKAGYDLKLNKTA